MAALPAPSGATPELSLVLPTRNEAGNVEPLLGRVREALREVDFELVFVDDSDDQTSSLLSQAAQLDPRVRVLHRPQQDRGGGLSTAVILGLHAARGRVVCVMDADLQHPPETIPAMLAAERRGADLVVASRYLPGGSREGLATGTRQFVSRAASLLVRALFHEARASSDPLAGFFLCRAELLRGVEFRPVGFKILLELMVCSPQARVAEVPLRFEARISGASKASLSQGLLFLRHTWSLIRDVPGSARIWKFAAIGVSGLLLFLLVLELGGSALGWPALAAWAVAFVLSGVWNFSWNLRITFADLRRERYPLLRRYVSATLTAGGAQLVLFLGLVGTTLPLVLDGLLAALLGMAVSAALNWQLARRHRRPARSPVGVDHLLAHLGRVGGAQLAALLDREGAPMAVWSRAGAGVTERLMALAGRAGPGGVPMVWTEPRSNRPQARTNVELASIMVLPLELAGFEGYAVALERNSRVAFSSADLEATMRQLERMLPRLALEAGPQLVPAPAPAPVSDNRERTGSGTRNRSS
ncbi:MAG TPA: glycosyltransferase [Candidatus Dormibacteraeota bacterium]|nr:glycosyltransferase [Candidatus Dormibacteraeota bacterium]